MQKAKLYKILQSINEIHNECYSPLVIPIRIIVGAVIGIASAKVLIKHISDISAVEIPAVVLLLQVGFGTPLLLLILSGVILEETVKLKKAVIRQSLLSIHEPTMRRSKASNKVARALTCFGVQVPPVKRLNFNGVEGFLETSVSELTTVLVGSAE